MLIRTIFLIFIFSLGINFSILAQSIRINEAVSSNSILLDEEGDSPDWFELHNSGTTTISLDNWSITDDKTNIQKWLFNNISLTPDDYLLVWASGKNRTNLTYARTLVNHGDLFRYHIPSSEPPTEWKTLNFDDNIWNQDISGFGYADGDDATIIPVGTRSVYVRVKFNITELINLQSMILDIDYDDGFVAYINGQEIARANITGAPPLYNSGTITDHEAKMYSGGIPERFIVTNPENILNEGENVLCIQIHNISTSSSDMTLIPFLSAVFTASNTSGITPPEILALTDGNFHTNFKISSVLETLILSDSQGNYVDSLRLENLNPDVSKGISVSDESIVYYTETTPGTINNTQEYIGNLSSEIMFSHVGGLVDGPISLSLTGNSTDEIIRYTTDATIPDETSSIYSIPINISTNVVIRAGLFRDNYIPSLSKSKTFIFNTNTILPVVTLVTDPYNFFDNDYGIYILGDSYDPNVPYFGANFWEDWERPVHFSLYENDGNLGFELNAGIKIFGGWSRANSQRSLSIFARGKYGSSVIQYPIFPTQNYNIYQSMVLRNSGNDWLRSMIRDITLTSMMEGSDLDYQQYKTVSTYLNGEYWGFYNLREKVNEHFLASKHNIDPKTIDLLETNGGIINGSNLEYFTLLNYINTTDISVDENFIYVSDNIDINNYILYQLSQIYFNNTDWPGNNIKYWKHPGGKWRWILFDTDFGFGPWNVYDYSNNTLSFALETNGPGWPNPPWSTFLFRKLIENNSFRNRFINRFADELNTRFLPNNVNNHIQSVWDVTSTEIFTLYNRWASDVPNWDAESYITNMKTFGTNRPYYMKQHIINQFSLPNIHNVTIINTNTTHGFVRLNNNLEINYTSWSGDYFEEVPITMEAIPKPGFEFSHWSGASSSANSQIILDLIDNISITPIFVNSNSDYNIVINEINYNSGTEVIPGDWIELYNPNPYILDVSNWILKDDNDTHIYIIPSGISIYPEDYLVIAKDSFEFNGAFPDVENYVGNFSFGLGSITDAVRVYDSNSVLMDEVYYTSSTPWPECANGLGHTLELKNPFLDNLLPENWDCINTYGSPGIENSDALYTEEFISELRVYPNPVKDYLFVDGIKDYSLINVKNISGETVLTKNNMDKLFVGKLKPGIYIVSINTDTMLYNFKIIKQ